MKNLPKITSKLNPLVKSVHLLKSKRAAESDLFICEGIKLVEEAVNSGSLIRYVFISDKFCKSKTNGPFIKKIKGLGLDVIHTADSIVDYLSDVVTHQGIIAVVKKGFYQDDKLFDGANGIILLLYKLQDPGNLGTIIRVAEAGGVKGIIITDGTVDPYNPKTVRATMGSIFRMPIAKIDDASNFIKKVKDLDYKSIGFFPKAKEEYFNADLTGPIILTFGHEAAGLPVEIGRLMDMQLKIPMSGDVESLNVAVSAAVVIYESMRQRRGKIC
ncbi:MAG: RNA methyltransferase [Nitrospirota bacterium]